MVMCGLAYFVSIALTGLNLRQNSPTDPLTFAAYTGGAAVLFSKAAKYAFFDATKEMIFIRLDTNSKSVGKAAIDIVAYRLSKAGGAFFLQFVFLVFGNLTDTGVVPIAVMFFCIMGLWLRAADEAGRRSRVWRGLKFCCLD